MIKQLILYLFGILFLNFILNDEVTLSISTPNTIDAGKDIQVEITLNKGEIEGFARFMQELPPGVTAGPGNSSDADFSFKEQKVRLIWLKLPTDEQIKFSYTIHASERLKGNFDLGGRFSYISDNKRKSTDIKPELIAIKPSPNINQNMIVDVADPGNAFIFSKDVNVADISNIVCIRQKPYLSTAGDEVIVNILINKGGNNSFAKIQEKIPQGFSAAGTEGNNPIFTFKNKMAKYLWMNLPANPFFVISYKLTPNNPASLDNLNIEGTFSYIENKNTLSVKIIEKDVDLTNTSEDNLLGIIEATLNDPNFNNMPYLTETPNPVKLETITQPTKTEISDALQPLSGYYYRVQIAAGHKPVNIKRYFKKRLIQDEVKVEVHENWKKYSIGPFYEYKDARDYRVHISNTTKIKDPFVAAYNNSKRITVQEALMELNQKWYR